MYFLGDSHDQSASELQNIIYYGIQTTVNYLVAVV